MRKLFVAVLVVTGAGLLWRLVSRRSVLPCPWWASVLVENPITESVAGAGLLLDRAGVGAAMNVLDVGCGPGRVALAAARRVGPEGRVVALDVQPRMLQRARSRADAAGLGNLETILAGAGRGALGDEDTFDAAFLITVLGEIPAAERTAALAEIHRALRPGGVLSVTELLPDPHFQGQATVRRLGEAAGFRVGPLFGYRGAYTMHLLKP
jgi:ubiquinone/menaquinone biosynthesis C-methylase UbiE